jgi:ATP-dependent Lon protease
MRTVQRLIISSVFACMLPCMLTAIPLMFIDGLVLSNITRTITPLDKKMEAALARYYQTQTPVAFVIQKRTDMNTLWGVLGIVTACTPQLKGDSRDTLMRFTIAMRDVIEIYNPDKKVSEVVVPNSNPATTELDLPLTGFMTRKYPPMSNRLPTQEIETIFQILHRKYKQNSLKKELGEAPNCNQCIQIYIESLELIVTPDYALEFITQDFSVQHKLTLLVKLILEQEKSKQSPQDIDLSNQLRERLNNLSLPEVANTYLNDLIDRFEKVQQNPQEGPGLESFLKFAFSLPWEDSLDTAPAEYDLEKIAATLDECQYGMEQVKDTILTHLALRMVSPEGAPFTLCLVGKPGTGKTSICSQIAFAINKPLYRISLAGSHMQSDILGTNRTYLNSQEGKILKALKTTKSASCVILLDEIDKMGNENPMHGSPANALLHVLDPEQNSNFFDEYLGTPFNISKVLFLATANNEREIPAALRDRMIIIHVPSYSIAEKIEIAITKIVPRLLEKMGLMSKRPTFTPEVIEAIINNYTFEDGLRGLTNQLNILLGKFARGYLRGEDIQFTPKNLSSYLGLPHNNLAEFKRKAKEIEPYLHTNARRKLFEAIEKFDVAKERTPEHEMLREYIANFLALPWEKTRSLKNSDLKRVATEIEATHYGARKVQEQVLDYLTLSQQNNSSNLSTTLCLVGNPGVGKTSIANSIAKALNKKVSRISMGGITSVEDLRGIQQAYRGSKLGALAQALKEAGSSDVVIILDEIDKIPTLPIANALLDVLDPSQNKAFFDNYLETTIDLSQVLFIATANDLGTIPYPLLDRMSIVPMEGYSEGQKIEIAYKHIIPNILAQSGLADAPYITQELLQAIIRGYTHELGVRQLTSRLKTVIARYARSVELEAPLSITPDILSTFFGPTRRLDEPLTEGVPGVVNGLYASAAGGGIGKIQVTISQGEWNSKQNLTSTGMLKQMTQESIQTALGYVKAHCTYLAQKYANYPFAVTTQMLNALAIHAHMTRGSEKDGNSAGLAFCTALISALTNRPANNTYAMTGEIDLLGNALAIGGLDQKLAGARRNGITCVFVPEENRPNIEALEEIPEGLEIVFVTHIEQILDRILLPAVPLDPYSPLAMSATPAQGMPVQQQ